MAGDRFRCELFIEPEEYEEMPLRDRKAMLPDLRHNGVKAEFIRDVIALANTARMLGKPAYLLYGIDKHGELCGIGDSTRYYDDLADPKLAERVRHRLGELLPRYVFPHVNLDVHTGCCEDKEVAYVRIEPTTHQSVFQVREDLLAGHQRLLHKGQCWIRFGESKSEVDRLEIAPSSDPYCYAYSQVPFVMPSVWRRYLEGLLSDREVDPAAAEYLPAYQTLLDDNGEAVELRIQQFLECEDRLLVISGPAGCGKTAILRRLTASLLTKGLEAVRVREQDEDYRPPQCWMPVYFALRGAAVNASWHLEQVLWDSINSVSRWAFWQETRPSCPEKLFSHSSLYWLICLDGLDEIASDAGCRLFGSKLRRFLQQFARVKVILTTRPDTDTSAFHEVADTLAIAPLAQEQVLAYLRNFVEDDSQRLRDVKIMLDAEPELWSLVKVPFYLEIAVRKVADTYPTAIETSILSAAEGRMPITADRGQTPLQESRSVSDLVTLTAALTEDLTLMSPVTNEAPEQEAELETEPSRAPLRLGWLLDEVFQEVWKREDVRHGENETRSVDWWNAVGNLALIMDGRCKDVDESETRRLLRPRRMDLIRRVLSLGILVRGTYLAPLRFGTEITKAYFAAKRIARLIQCRAYSRAQKALDNTTPEFRTRVLGILQSITASSLEPLNNGGAQ